MAKSEQSTAEHRKNKTDTWHLPNEDKEKIVVCKRFFPRYTGCLCMLENNQKSIKKVPCVYRKLRFNTACDGRVTTFIRHFRHF